MVVMTGKYLVFIAACFVLACTKVSGQGLQVIDGKIKMTVGTTSGCIHTVNFIRDRLDEAQRLYGDYLDIEIVPWGRTTLSSDGVFSCQFGAPDCWANRLNRCVLNMLKDDQAAQVHYMVCEFTGTRPAFWQGTYLCAQAVGLNLVDVDYCVSHPGDDLDRQAQAVTAEPLEIIGGIPYIFFNGVPDRDVAIEARATLTSMICFALAADPSTGVTSCQI